MSDKDLAIKVENVSKLFRIGFENETHDTFAETFLSFIKSPLENYRNYRTLYRFDDMDFEKKQNTDNALWALRDISFTVERGKILGIIGINGAGKSTLLKILARITPPTTGRVEIRGRISSLLEVGTGFHPELTGRENVYLNATILGMRKKEVDDKFDSIVDFSGVEKFLDTPVKRYSSGMRVRLAFAVAAHLEPEILIVDEVLAVGDSAFQKKCINKMQDIGQLGATVMFVSHSMPAITRMCSRALLLEDGYVSKDGQTNEVVNAYLSTGLGTTPERVWDPASAPGDDVVRLRSVRVRSDNGKTLDFVDIRQAVAIDMDYEVLQGGSTLLPNFNIYNEDGTCLFSTLEQDASWKNVPRPAGVYRSTAWIPGNFLSEGTVYIEPAMMTPAPFRPHFLARDAAAFQVFDPGEGDSARGSWGGAMMGVVRPMLKWETQLLSQAVAVHG